MKVEKVAIDDLRVDPRNARRHPVRNLQAIKRSLERFGQQKPIVVAKDGTILAGSGVLQAATDLGWSEIVVVRTSLTSQDAVAFSLADNQTALLSEWDHDVLAELLKELTEWEEEAVAATGFDEDAVAALLGDMDRLVELGEPARQKGAGGGTIKLNSDQMVHVERLVETARRNIEYRSATVADCVVLACREYVEAHTDG